MVPDIHAHLDAQERNFTRLSGGLVEVLAHIEMTPLRLRVLATAGNGKTLVAQHFLPKQIAVLSCRGREHAALRAVQRVGNHTLARFTGEYDQFGNQVVSPGQVLCDTVRRFKGQQEAAVILVDVDPRQSRLPQELQVLFCGMTRATVRPEVVCNAANPWVAERILLRA